MKTTWMEFSTRNSGRSWHHSERNGGQGCVLLETARHPQRLNHLAPQRCRRSFIERPFRAAPGTLDPLMAQRLSAREGVELSGSRSLAGAGKPAAAGRAY